MIQNLLFPKGSEERAALFQSLYAANSNGNGLLRVPGRIFVHYIGMIGGYFFGNFVKLSCTISTVAARYFKKQSEYKSLGKTTDPLTASAAMIAVTVITHRFYTLSSTVFQKGFLLGLHFMIAESIAYAPLKKEIDQGIYAHILGQNRTLTTINKKTVEKYTHTLFLISNIAITYRYRNPILATTAAYTIAAATKAIVLHLLSTPKLYKERK